MSRRADVRRAVDLVSYQDGAVVSRIVVKRETGTIALFAFDAGQELSEHTAPYDAVVQVLAASRLPDSRIAYARAR
jgi:quercetin dioxygenase-like cupin family protein